MFCKHDWQVLSEAVTKSEFELLLGMENLTSVKNASNSKTIVQIISCKKCGKLKKFVTESY